MITLVRKLGPDLMTNPTPIGPGRAVSLEQAEPLVQVVY